MNFENRHLKQKNGHWHYQRRIPTRYARFDDRRVVAQRRYKTAKVTSLARGFTYVPAADLAEMAGLDEIVERLRVVESVGTGKSGPVQEAEVQAVPGGTSPPPVTVSEAFEIYCTEIASLQLVHKSESQRAS